MQSQKLIPQNVEKLLISKKCRIMHCLRVTDSQNFKYTKFMFLRHTRNDEHIVSFVAVATEELPCFLKILPDCYILPGNKCTTNVHSIPSNSILWITCLIKHASHIPEYAFTRESLSGGKLLNSLFTKKAQ